MTALTGEFVSIVTVFSLSREHTGIGDGLLDILEDTTTLILSTVGVATDGVASLLGG